MKTTKKSYENQMKSFENQTIHMKTIRYCELLSSQELRNRPPQTHNALLQCQSAVCGIHRQHDICFYSVLCDFRLFNIIFIWFSCVLKLFLYDHYCNSVAILAQVFGLGGWHSPEGEYSCVEAGGTFAFIEIEGDASLSSWTSRVLLSSTSMVRTAFTAVHSVATQVLGFGLRSVRAQRVRQYDVLLEDAFSPCAFTAGVDTFRDRL